MKKSIHQKNKDNFTNAISSNHSISLITKLKEDSNTLKDTKDIINEKEGLTSLKTFSADTFHSETVLIT